MSSFIWRGTPKIEATFEQKYQNLRSPLLDVRDIARLVGIAQNDVTQNTTRNRKYVKRDLSFHTSRRDGDHGHIEAATSATRNISLLDNSFYSGELTATTHGPALFALAMYAEKTPQPTVLYNGMSAMRSLVLRVAPEKKIDDKLLNDVRQFIVDSNSEDAHARMDFDPANNPDVFTLRYEGKTTAVAAQHHALFNEVFGSTSALDSSIILFGAPLEIINKVSEEALAQSTPFTAGQHVQRVLGLPQHMPNSSILDFWSRQ